MAIIKMGAKKSPDAAQSSESQVAVQAQAAPQAAPPNSGGWMKRGAARKKALAEAEASRGKGAPFRFFLKRGESKTVTFLDGPLDADGELDIPMYHDHFVKIAGKVHNFPCLEDHDIPCPLCESGNRASFIGLMTIIDHTPWTDKEGKQHQASVRLFAPKITTYRTLNVYASKYGGLAGVKFEITRSDGEHSPAVGDVFVFDSKGEIEAIKEKYGVSPVNYEEVIQLTSESDLRKMGFGGTVIGAEATQSAGIEVDAASEL